MKQTFSFSATTLIIALLCICNINKARAQRYLSEKRPDLVLTAVKVQKEGVDQLNVIWSIKNTGDATATEFDNLVALNVESSNKAVRAGVANDWVLRGNRLPLNISKKELKAGETISGSCLISCSAQDLVCLRVSIDLENEFYELQKGNNTLVTLLVGK